MKTFECKLGFTGIRSSLQVARSGPIVVLVKAEDEKQARRKVRDKKIWEFPSGVNPKDYQAVDPLKWTVEDIRELK